MWLVEKHPGPSRGRPDPAGKPNLLDFLTGHGTLITHEHTPLIAHTADDSVTLESGLYGAGQGIPIANEFNYYKPDGTTDTAGSFAYWTDPIVDYDTGLAAKPVGDNTTTMIGTDRKTPPAPWASYTKAGCNFGTVASANTELENTLPDVPHVFGANSPEAREAANPNLQSKAEADFMGLAVHCALGSAVCGAGSRPDALPDEPGGYHGYRALYGNKFIQPAISPGGPVRNLDGQVIKDSSGDIGFPGYDGMTGVNSLAYTLDMQLHGVPVTMTYLSDLHDNFNGSGQTQRLTSYLADPVELKILHMVTGDPRRTPSLVLFGNENFWLSSGNASCGKSCFSEPKGGDAWNHGTTSEQINKTWLGMVGPGVAHLGIDNPVWSDHSDTQPTMMALLGLGEHYLPDGRVLGEIFDPSALPPGMRAHRGTLLRLGKTFTQLEAPVGAFCMDTLRASTRALASDSPGDAAYTRMENALQRLGTERDAVGERMRALLLDAAFGGRPLDVTAARALIRAGDRLLGRAAVLGA